MRFKLLAVVCFSLAFNVFAENKHIHPKAEESDKQSNWAGYCEIEIKNNSSHSLRVTGIFDDRSVTGFNIYWYDFFSHYISLYYYGYCHQGMVISIDTFGGYRIFDDYVYGGQTIYVENYLRNSVKAAVKK